MSFTTKFDDAVIATLNIVIAMACFISVIAIVTIMLGIWRSL